MRKNILLPTDFSRNAWNAAMYARELYKNEECTFYLTNAFSNAYVALGDIGSPASSSNFYDTAQEISQVGLDKALKRIVIKPAYQNHTYKTLSYFDLPLEAIKTAVDEKDIELIVMGSKGEMDNVVNVFGSTTISVMEKVRNCPVLAIPGDLTYKEPKEIVFPTNYKTHFKRRELQHMYEIAKLTNAAIRILYVKDDIKLTTEQKNNKQLLENCLEGLEYSHNILDNTNLLEGLHNFVQSRGSDMIAFINKKHAFFNTFFIHPMVKDLGHDSKIPILVMHDLKN
tara:strand:+ start:1902 stop:2753 length:852 start_codon:yes stop_codon:yes gene_type:complete